MKIFINLPTWLGDSIMASVALRLIFSHFEELINVSLNKIKRYFVGKMKKQILKIYTYNKDIR